MEFTLKLKEEIVDKLEQISESIGIIQERCEDYHYLNDFLQTPWGMTHHGSMYYEVTNNRRNNTRH